MLPILHIARPSIVLQITITDNQHLIQKYLQFKNNIHLFGTPYFTQLQIDKNKHKIYRQVFYHNNFSKWWNSASEFATKTIERT